MTEAEIEKEIEIIDKKLANAFIDNLSAEDYGKLLDRKLDLLLKLFEKNREKGN